MNGAQGVVKIMWFGQISSSLLFFVQLKECSAHEMPAWQDTGPSCPVIPVVALIRDKNWKKVNMNLASSYHGLG